MIIDNKKATVNFQLRRLLILFLFSIVIILLFNINYFREPVFGISRTAYTIALVIIYLAYYITGIVRNFNYFFYSDNGRKLIFRFYSLRPLSKRQSAIEIDKANFITFSIQKPLFGFFKKLHLTQRMPSGTVATYPPVSISLLKKSEIKNLELSLKSFSKR